jgi:hypothetical protein
MKDCGQRRLMFAVHQMGAIAKRPEWEMTLNGKWDWTRVFKL